MLDVILRTVSWPGRAPWALPFVLAVLAATVDVRAQQRPTVGGGTASLGGRVVDHDSRQPLAEVIVTLSTPERAALTTLTDGDGQYLFEGVGAGRYHIIAERDGYVRAQFGQAEVGAISRDTLTVGSGERRRGLEIALVRGGSLGGRISSAMGEPLKDASVSALLMLPGGGSRITGGQGFFARTNDRGEYRVDNLPAGDYLVMARWFDPGRLTAQAAPDEATAYYPETADRNQALAVRVARGETVMSVDVRVERTRRYTISGHVLRGVVDAPIEVVLVTGNTSSRSAALSADDAFRLTYLSPGRYTLWARTRDEAATEAAVIALDVQDDLTGLTLPMMPTGRIEGRVVTTEGAPLADGTAQVIAALVDGGHDVDPLPRDRVLVGSDGTFAIGGLFGERVLRVIDPSGAWQVDRILRGRTDIQSVSVSPGVAVGDIAIVVSRK